MPSPTFNSNKIFDSLYDTGGDTISEGVLWVPSYSAITQKIHFEGEVGDWTLYHGYPDMEWVFEGYIAGTTQSQFNTIIQGIQSAIDDGASGNYHTLVDSFGNNYPQAQVRVMTYTEAPRIWISSYTGTTPNFGYITKVKVMGIIQGNTQVGN